LEASNFTKWSQTLKDAVISGSTGTEIFVEVKVTLDQLLREESSLSPNLKARAEAILAFIHKNLKHFRFNS
jgi:hypothetical protein